MFVQKRTSTKSIRAVNYKASKSIRAVGYYVNKFIQCFKRYGSVEWVWNNKFLYYVTEFRLVFIWNNVNFCKLICARPLMFTSFLFCEIFRNLFRAKTFGKQITFALIYIIFWFQSNLLKFCEFLSWNRPYKLKKNLIKKQLKTCNYYQWCDKEKSTWISFLKSRI